MKKLIAFGASNSKNSINKQLASYVANTLENVEIEILDLNDYEMPIYGIDKEKESGVPELAQAFKAKLDTADAFIISFAEHNGAYTAAYKNIYHWVSRITKDVWNNNPMLLLSTSPGGRGGKGVMDIAFGAISFSNNNVVGKFSLPKFGENFDPENGIKDADLRSELNDLVAKFQSKI